MADEKVAPKVEVKSEAPSPEKIMELLQRVAQLEAKEKEGPKVAAAPVEAEIDWSKVGDREIADLNFPIPVIEHELPDYMTVHLADNSYIAKWIHKSPSHLGTMLASGYELIKASDWDSNFPLVLHFNAEGHLTFEDVIACKVHKSRYLGKIRREQLKSMQIRGIAGYDKVKGAVNNSIANIPGMESAINRGAMSFYGEKADSAIEVQI